MSDGDKECARSRRDGQLSLARKGRSCAPYSDGELLHPVRLQVCIVSALRGGTRVWHGQSSHAGGGPWLLRLGRTRACARARLSIPHTFNSADLADLTMKVLAFIGEWNQRARPFSWTKNSFEKILGKVDAALRAEVA